MPLEDRKAKLMEIVRESPRILISRHVETYGKRYFEGIVRMGLEGAMAKRRLSTYQMGKRSRDWLKVKNLKTMDCVILGYTPGEGWREQYFGALVLGAYKGDELVYVGRAGTGFDEETVKLITDMLRKMKTHEKAVELEEPLEVRWVRPELVCEVKFLELTHDLKLRAPSFMRLRDEKAPEECRIDEG
jgi:bifunctional non-homologous end joining protein LigD